MGYHYRILLASLALPLLALLGGCNGASDIARDELDKPNTGFMTKTLQRGMWTRKYALFVPHSYHPGTTQKYPVIIFLHGIGEGDGLGEGNLKNLTVGLGPAVARKADQLDFFVIFPQSDGNWSPDSAYTQDIFTALANTAREYPIDSDRVCLTGLSTGGAGTWAIGARYHDQFAAIVPMGSNGSHSSDAENLTHVSVRAYCSAFGDIFAGWNDAGMVHKIKELNPSANAEFISTPTVGHDCWENVYGGDELFAWMKQQRREGAVAGTPSAAPAAASYQPAVAAPAAALTPAPVSAPAPHPQPVVNVPVSAPVIAAPAPRRASAARPSGTVTGSADSVNTPW